MSSSIVLFNLLRLSVLAVGILIGAAQLMAKPASTAPAIALESVQAGTDLRS